MMLRRKVLGLMIGVMALVATAATAETLTINMAKATNQGTEGIDFTGLMCLYGKAGLSDEVKEDVGAAIQYIADLQGYQRIMSKNDLAAFYTDSCTASAAQDTMFKVMGPVVAEIIADQ